MSKTGEVHLKFSKVEAVLVPTPHALRTVLTELGGALNVYHALSRMEYQAVFALIKAGTKQADTRWTKSDDEALDAEIFDYGLSELVKPCTRYLTLLINGGREPEEVEDDADSGKG